MDGRGTIAHTSSCARDAKQSMEAAMPRGDKSAYTDKQKRKAEHIEESYESRGVGHD